jgi:hypothetical protein
MGRRRRLEASSPLRPESEINLPFLVSKCWKLPRKCVVEVQMQILLWKAGLMVFRWAKSLFRASLVVKSQDVVVS